MKKTRGSNLTAYTVAEIILEDFLGPFMCWDTGSKLIADNPNKKSPSRGSARNNKKKKLSPTLRGSKRQADRKDKSGKATPICEELTDFHSLVTSTESSQDEREDEGGREGDVGRQATKNMIKESYKEHNQLRQELDVIKEESSRLHAENENWKRLYETSKKSSTFQEEKNLRLKARNAQLLQEGEELQDELIAMKRQIEVIRREQQNAVQHLDTSIF